jgi:protein-S-isoprenylcysteine O-methyltransferase Ste14
MSGTWRWGNVPLPESHLVLVVVALVLDAVWPKSIGLGTTWARLVGVTLILLGVAGVVWATRTAGRVNLVEPDRLVTLGPYGRSRHPMYVAWTIIYLGAALVFDSVWFLVLLPVLAVWVHIESGREEKRMSRDFGSAYEQYQGRVRRYL